MSLPEFVIRWSHSTRELFHTCPRLYQLERLLKGQRDRETSPHFSRGHAFGKGVQTYLVTQDMDLALFQAWLSYSPILEDPPKVTLHRTLHALMCARKAMDTLLETYEVVSFKGLPSAELGFKLIIKENFNYVGFIDLVLRNKTTGLYVILECKYTGTWYDPRVTYENSGQGIGYSIVLDNIVGRNLADYGVLYFVCQDKEKLPVEIQFHTLEFKKTLKDRLNWFLSLGIDVENHARMKELNTFPKHGENCIRFNKTCKHFGTCGFSAGEKYRSFEEDPHEKADRYQFVYKLEDIIQSHLERTE